MNTRPTGTSDALPDIDPPAIATARPAPGRRRADLSLFTFRLPIPPLTMGRAGCADRCDQRSPRPDSRARDRGDLSGGPDCALAYCFLARERSTATSGKVAGAP